MGSSASKQAARRLPRQVNAAVRMERPKQSPSTIKQVYQSEADMPMEETRDPQLHKKLAQLGPVKVPELKTKIRSIDPMINILDKRRRIEEEQSNSTPINLHTLTVDDIYACLETRKRLPKDQFSLATLATKYNISEAAATTLFHYYNTITVLPSPADDSHDRRQGIWVNSYEEWTQAVQDAKDKKPVATTPSSPPQSSLSSKRDSDERQEREHSKHKRLKDLFED